MTKDHLTITIRFLTHSRTWALNQPPCLTSSTAQMRPAFTTPTRFHSSSHRRVPYTELSLSWSRGSCRESGDTTWNKTKYLEGPTDQLTDRVNDK